MCLPAFSKALRLVFALLCRALALPHRMLCMLLAWPSGLRNICGRTRASTCSLPPPVLAKRNTARRLQGAPVAEAMETVTQILLPPHRQRLSQKQKAGRVGNGEAVGTAWRLYVPLSLFLSFLKKKQKIKKGRKKEKVGGEQERKESPKPMCFCRLEIRFSLKKIPPSSTVKMVSGAGSIHRQYFALKPFKLLRLVSFVLTPCTPSPGASTWTSVSSCSFFLWERGLVPGVTAKTCLVAPERQFLGLPQ